MLTLLASGRLLAIGVDIVYALLNAAPQFGRGGWSAPVREVEARAAVPALAETGDPLWAEIQLHNVGAKATALTFIPGWTTRVVLMDSRGRRIRPRREYRWIEGPLDGVSVIQQRGRTLLPGETCADQVDIHRLYELDAPGQYWVVLGQRLGQRPGMDGGPTVWTPPRLFVLDK